MSAKTAPKGLKHALVKVFDDKDEVQAIRKELAAERDEGFDVDYSAALVKAGPTIEARCC